MLVPHSSEGLTIRPPAPGIRPLYCYPAAELTGTATAARTLFLLPGGLPRRFVVTSEIQDGGLPRRRPRPSASLSRLTMASSICCLSAFNSVSILLTSIFDALRGPTG